MRVANDIYQGPRWRIFEIAPDLNFLDSWDLPVEGSREDFDAFLQVMRTFNPRQSAPLTVRALFWLRDRMGRWFRWNDGGWDGRTLKLPIPGCTETTLGGRLPEELKQSVPA